MRQLLAPVLPQTPGGIAIASIASSLVAHIAGLGIVVWLAAAASTALLDTHLTSRPGAALSVTLVTPTATESVEQPVAISPVTPDAHPVTNTTVVSPTIQPINLDRTPAPPAQYLAVVSSDVAGPIRYEDSSQHERQDTVEPTPAPTTPGESTRPRPRTERPIAKPPAANLVAIPVVAGVESDEGPAFLDNPPPEYPPVALARRWQGEVVLRVWIDVDGRVRRAELDRSSGHEVLDQAALRAVRQWRARPAREHGRAVETVQLQPIVFRLDRRGT